MSTPKSSHGKLTPEELLRISDQIVRNVSLDSLLPRETEVVLLAVDPFRVHVYWNVDRADLFRTRLETGDACATLCLRVHHLADGQSAWKGREHSIRGLSSREYLDMPESGADCFVELGMKLEDKTFVCLAESDRVSLPRHCESPHYEMVPVDTRVELEDEAEEEAPLGEGMDGPLPLPERALDWTSSTRISS